MSRYNTGRWMKEEHEAFLRGVDLHDRDWDLIAVIVTTRSVLQVRTHGQKYFTKLEKGEAFPEQPYASMYDLTSASSSSSSPSSIPAVSPPSPFVAQNSERQQQQLTMAAAAAAAATPGSAFSAGSTSTGGPLSTTSDSSGGESVASPTVCWASWARHGSSAALDSVGAQPPGWCGGGAPDASCQVDPRATSAEGSNELGGLDGYSTELLLQQQQRQQQQRQEEQHLHMSDFFEAGRHHHHHGQQQQQQPLLSGGWEPLEGWLNLRLLEEDGEAGAAHPNSELSLSSPDMNDFDGIL